MNQSNAIAYLERKGWHYEMNGDQAKVAICPLCKKDKFHFYINTTGNKDGLWACHYCGKSGNLKTLQSNPDPAIGEAHISNVRSMKDWANGGQQPDPLPDYERCHAALMEDDDALDYLYTIRGFSPEVVQKMKLGVQEYGGKKWLVIPYFDRHAQYTFCKFRTLPPADKDFRSPRHREAGLYNEECIRREMDELVIVEGECDAISCLSNGVENVVGVPGANVQKASWLGLLDSMKPKQIYILYDTDHVGTKAAQQLAQRIGVDRCLKIALPEFCRLDGQPGKDINEWFLAGHTAEDFQALKESAVQFDVEGVVNAAAAMDELEEEILDKGELKGTYAAPWSELNEIMGPVDPGDVVAVIAEAKHGKTTLCDQWMDWFTVEYEQAAMMLNKEMQPKKLVRKLVSRITQTEDKPGNITIDTLRHAKSILADRKADLLYCYSKGADFKKDADTIRQTVRRYGVKMVVIDNLQCYARSVTHQANEIFVLSKMVKELAMELAPMGVWILLIVQPNRVRDGEIVAARNASGSSGIEKDVDCMIALHRNRVGKIKADQFQGFMETDDNFEPQMLVRVDLSRYASGGTRTLLFDGAKSTISSLPVADRVVKQPSNDFTLKDNQPYVQPEV